MFFVNLKRIASIVLGLVFFSLSLVAQSETEPNETLTWSLEDFEDETGVLWTTARFETLRGAQYILQSSPDLDSWTPEQSFYALDRELHLALFQNTPPEISEEDLNSEASPE